MAYEMKDESFLDDNFDLMKALDDKISVGELWLGKCSSHLSRVQGINKLTRKIISELHFLKSLRAKNCDADLKADHLHSSNLVHLQSIVHAACTAQHVTAVLQPFNYSSATDGIGGSDVSKSKIVVDVVSDDGDTWIKVVARNRNSLNQISLGQGHFGERSILDHAQSHLACAAENLHFYRRPNQQFLFYNGIAAELSERLHLLGVSVRSVEHLDCSVLTVQNDAVGNIVSGAALCLTRIDRPHLDNAPLNLDVSTMLAYVSSLTNGGCDYTFREPVLTEQAARERICPVKPLLDDLFRGRELTCCSTAVSDFNAIVDKVGGRNEQLRAAQFLQRVTVVPDAISPGLSSLRLGGKVRRRSQIIFGTGDLSKSVTVTANSGFVRAAQSQGISLAVYVHESRALSEDKEKSAEPIL